MTYHRREPRKPRARPSPGAAWARILLALAASLLCAWPQPVRAGGTEFPADGTRGLGRGGARAARADDPTIMTRNPAALALLWDHQATLGSHLLLVDACMQPTGYYGWGVAGPEVFRAGDEVLSLAFDEGDLDAEGNPLDVGYYETPYPEVCYQGPAPFLPHVALSMKLDDDLGVGLGFFPPDSAQLFQWGNRDGTIETPDGTRPNPLRYYRSHQNVSYFSILGAAGYSVAPWISVGLGFQWMLAVFEATTWSTPSSGLDPERDVRGDLFGRDLFIPGLIASVHLTPLDFLDVVVGFKWSDRVKSKAKIDVTTGAFGLGEPFEFYDASSDAMVSLGSSIPSTTPNLQGVVDSPPVWAPQLTAAVRFADRLKPKPQDLELAHEAADGAVEDHMSNELWDIEVDVIYYLTSVYDRAEYRAQNATVLLRTVDGMGNELMPLPGSPGDCLRLDAAGQNCIGDRVVWTDLGGKDQLTVRAGGDYNVLPGLLSVRAGLSYETRGQDPSSLNVFAYMLTRTGLHAGLTVRLAGKTDLSFGFAHFIQEEIRLQVFNGESTSVYGAPFRTPEYHFEPGAGVPDGSDMGADRGGFDGTAGVEIPNADKAYSLDVQGPYYLNAGSYYYNLDVLSVSVTQHF